MKTGVGAVLFGGLVGLSLVGLITGCSSGVVATETAAVNIPDTINTPIHAVDAVKMTTVSGGFQNTSFYAEGRYWLFYVDDTSYKYTSSEDGLAWLPSQVLLDEGQCEEGEHFDMVYDGEDVHVVYAFGGYGLPIRYYVGVPQPDGRIQWDINIEVLKRRPGEVYMQPTITVDQNKEVYISYWLKDNSQSYVLQVSDPDNPQLIAEDSNTIQVAVAGNDIYAIYFSGGDLLCRTGSITRKQNDDPELLVMLKGSDVAWQEAVEVVAQKVNDYSRFVVAAEGNKVHVAYLSTYKRNIKIASNLGKGWNVPLFITAGDNFPLAYMSLEVVNGKPMLVYINAPTVDQIYLAVVDDLAIKTERLFTAQASIVLNSLATTISGDTLIYTYATIGEGNYQVNYGTKQVE